MTEELSFNFIDEAIQFLKDIGIYDQLINMAKTAAVNLCAKFFPRNICQAIVDNL